MPFRKSKLQYSLLFLLLLWSALAQFAISGYLIVSHTRNLHNGVLPFQVAMQEDSLELRGAPDELRAMGLEAGDELVALDGEVITGFRQLERKRFAWRPGQEVRVTVRRTEQGAPHMMERMVPVSVPHGRTISWTITIVLYTIVPIFSLILGFTVAFARPREMVAWLTLAMLASFSQLGPANFFGLPDPWMEVVVGYRSLMTNTWPFWVMLFGLYFPRPFRFLRNRPWIPVLLAAPFALLLSVDVYTDFYDPSRVTAIRGLAHVEERLGGPETVFFIACISSFFVSLTIKFFKSRDADARRRLQWLLTGTGLALFPSLLLQLIRTFFQVELPIWFWATAVLSITLFPVTLAYVIVVQRAMEVRVALRAGVQYAFARGGIWVLRLAVSAVVIVIGINLLQSSSGVVTPVLLFIAAAGFLALVGKAGKQLAAWTDRRFFREAYDTQIILTELSQNVAGMRDTKAVLETVTRQISDSLHVRRVAVLLNSSDAFRPAYALGFESTPNVELLSQAQTIRVLKEQQKPSTVYFDDDESWVQQLGDRERTMLRLLDSQLLLPVALKERLLGVISLGPKLSEAPYSATDMRLLSAVASQTGLALENARLMESVRREIAERERVNRELEIAREVQQRLFPQELPVISGLDFAGYCRPQQDVGGDYYDFIRLPDSCLGIAVGDVSGKGIAAALMMATLQASLRSQTMRPSGGPAEILALMNQLVYDASSSNRYATFFYGQYDARTGRFVYVNAGHNPPVVCRRKGEAHEILRLQKGGTVLGLFPEVTYQEACVQLTKGDVLVGFTDGISEAMNVNNDEWEEEALIRAISECEGRTASDVISHILERVDAFVQGAEQHDDMTLVALRMQ